MCMLTNCQLYQEAWAAMAGVGARSRPLPTFQRQKCIFMDKIKNRIFLYRSILFKYFTSWWGPQKLIFCSLFSIPEKATATKKSLHRFLTLRILGGVCHSPTIK